MKKVKNFYLSFKLKLKPYLIKQIQIGEDIKDIYAEVFTRIRLNSDL
jgi:hypothetical protein